MLQTNRLTIIPSDGTVFIDNGPFVGLDLSLCGIPENIHALQWKDNSGWIEFIGPDHNLPITQLPDWALNCINAWEQNYNNLKNAGVTAFYDGQQIV